jgi:hypothetical protein
LKPVRSLHSESQVCANLFFAMINLEMSAQAKKRDWFDLGAMAYRQACPGIYAAATYVCPICRKPFTVEALDDGRLSKEHGPPQSVGGCELLLTCTECNNTAGTKLDAAVKFARHRAPIVYIRAIHCCNLKSSRARVYRSNGISNLKSARLETKSWMLARLPLLICGNRLFGNEN